MLYPSTMFRVNGVDPTRAKDAWATIPRLMQEAEARGMRFPRKGAIVRPQKHPSEWRVNITQLKNDDGSAIDGTDARQISEGELQGRRQVMQAFDFLKTVPGFEDSYIIDIAPQVGIRETRRVMCDYMLSESDVLDCADFDDTIGVNGWPIEEHISGDVRFRFSRHSPRARLQPAAVPHVVAAEGAQSRGRGPLRRHDAWRPIRRARLRRMLCHGRGGGDRRGTGARLERNTARGGTHCAAGETRGAGRVARVILRSDRWENPPRQKRKVVARPSSLRPAEYGRGSSLP
jgi:hypothetical protein